jgi:hypothetical protein
VWTQTHLDSGEWLTHWTVPANDCSKTVSSPIVVGDWVLLPMNLASSVSSCSEEDKEELTYGETLLGYSLVDLRLHVIDPGPFETAGTLTYWEEKDLVIWPILGRFPGKLLTASTLAAFAEVRGFAAGADVSSLVLDGLMYFTTANPGNVVCQDPINPDCGAVAAYDVDVLDVGGNVAEQVHRIDIDDGFRVWISGAPTTDGSYVYAGGSSEYHGLDEDGNEVIDGYRYGCSALKFNPDLTIASYHDPGDTGCVELESGFWDAIVGEMPIGPTGIWAQYDAPNKDFAKDTSVALYRPSAESEELRVKCNALLPGSSQLQTARFYQAPSVDADGNAYVLLNLSDEDEPESPLYAHLYRIDGDDCEATELVKFEARAYSTPVLVDDSHILVPSGGILHVVALDGTIDRQYALASDSYVEASPMVHDGVVYVRGFDGSLTVIEGSGISGYGTAAWPRFRGDNHGRATWSP